MFVKENYVSTEVSHVTLSHDPIMLKLYSRLLQNSRDIMKFECLVQIRRNNLRV